MVPLAVSKRATAQALQEDPILLPEIVDDVFLVAVHPTGAGEHEELRCTGHDLRLPGEDCQRRPCPATHRASAAFLHYTASRWQLADAGLR